MCIRGTVTPAYPPVPPSQLIYQPGPHQSTILITNGPGTCSECLCRHVPSPFPVAGQLGRFQLFIITNKVCLQQGLCLSRLMLLIEERDFICRWSARVWRLKRFHNHSFVLIRSPPERLNVLLSGEGRLGEEVYFGAILLLQGVSG